MGRDSAHSHVDVGTSAEGIRSPVVHRPAVQKVVDVTARQSQDLGEGGKAFVNTGLFVLIENQFSLRTSCPTGYERNTGGKSRPPDRNVSTLAMDEIQVVWPESFAETKDDLEYLAYLEVFSSSLSLFELRIDGKSLSFE